MRMNQHSLSTNTTGGEIYSLQNSPTTLMKTKRRWGGTKAKLMIWDGMKTDLSRHSHVRRDGEGKGGCMNVPVAEYGWYVCLWQMEIRDHGYRDWGLRN